MTPTGTFDTLGRSKSSGHPSDTQNSLARESSITTPEEIITRYSKHQVSQLTPV
ncbi:hypothetical protein HMPREF0573_11275 [Mobiluncus curtisii ATCC 43063]|uniref:Uncharacterized protein n=1 Tax=Mobiluncus curtisii (strain ATCC 43063 / DSM 2711 / V125) TaxID=548479 RepID=D6ZG36_MOBCV|nr:hypothetical protein HMPREF0573_11275 [Mobiluncus curtisii ATCC 43063]